MPSILGLDTLSTFSEVIKSRVAMSSGVAVSGLYAFR